ncbi:MAG: GGDEF domain-containing protein [Deltaproteobacteria bacterium]|nr:GGDEF domain-containing protein [Deltaproteobacteria bacterium]
MAGDNEKNTGRAKRQGKTVVTLISKIQERQRSRKACLLMVYGPEVGKRYIIDRASLVIGRSSTCDIQLGIESVSRNHAKVLVRDKQVLIRDLGSTNGTYVNDRAIDEYRLRHGDRIQVGRIIFKFLVSGNLENSFREEIYRLTVTDGLTGAYNRRYLLEQLSKEISRSRRYERDLSVVNFDVDQLHVINDEFGQLGGDAVLRQLAQSMLPRIRREDLLARQQGGEFTVLLPETGKRAAMKFAEKIRSIIELEMFEFQGLEIPVTVSLGVVTLGPDDSDAEDLLRRAAEKMFEAKEAGRNTVRG